MFTVVSRKARTRLRRQFMRTKMKILGIETSCDETTVAIVEDGSRIISNVVAS